MQRRGFLGAMLSAAVAPAFVRPTSLMPLWVPTHALAPEVIATIPNVTAAVSGMTYEQFCARVIATMVFGMGLPYEEIAKNPQLYVRIVRPAFHDPTFHSPLNWPHSGLIPTPAIL